jgi:hypothetical protein
MSWIGPVGASVPGFYGMQGFGTGRFVIPARIRIAAVVRRGHDHGVAIAEVLEDDGALATAPSAMRREP